MYLEMQMEAGHPTFPVILQWEFPTVRANSRDLSLIFQRANREENES